MKLELLISKIAAGAVLVTEAGFTTDVLAMPLIAASAGALFLLVASGDYSRRNAYHLAPVLVRPRELRPLAA